MVDLPDGSSADNIVSTDPKGSGSETDSGDANRQGVIREEIYQAVVEHVADGIAITVGAERVFVNRAFLSIHGLNTPSDIYGLPFDYFIVDEDREATQRRVSARLKGEPVDDIVEYRIRRPDGDIRTVQVSVVATTYEGKPAILSVLRDVTDLKEAESVIRRLNKELEQHIRDLTVTNHDLETFNSTVSHDLRTPLTAIAGFAKRMEEHCSTGADERCRGYLGIIRSNAHRMEQLITDLLSYSKLGRQAMQSGVISMDELTQSVLIDLKRQYPEGTVTIKPLPNAIADERLIRQVLENLLSNAMKFTKLKPERVIEVEGFEQDGESVYTVQDNGAGFDVLDTERLFDIFQRFHSSDQFEGTGVGLAIVKRIVSLHGGRVWAEGKPEEGAAFHFTLPYAGGIQI